MIPICLWVSPLLDGFQWQQWILIKKAQHTILIAVWKPRVNNSTEQNLHKINWDNRRTKFKVQGEPRLYFAIFSLKFSNHHHSKRIPMSKVTEAYLKLPSILAGSERWWAAWWHTSDDQHCEVYQSHAKSHERELWPHLWGSISPLCKAESPTIL